MGTNGTSPSADSIQWEDQTSIVFSPRPFLKTEQILANHPPVMITEPTDNEDVKCEVNSGSIKCEQEVVCKENPDLLTVRPEPVESVHITSLSDYVPVKAAAAKTAAAKAAAAKAAAAEAAAAEAAAKAAAAAEVAAAEAKMASKAAAAEAAAAKAAEAASNAAAAEAAAAEAAALKAAAAEATAAKTAAKTAETTAETTAAKTALPTNRPRKLYGGYRVPLARRLIGEHFPFRREGKYGCRCSTPGCTSTTRLVCTGCDAPYCVGICWAMAHRK